MRDYLQTTCERTVVFDGGMGATLEQFEKLSLERDYRLPGRCHEVLVLNRPDVIEGVHASMLEAGADVIETDTFQASRLKLGEWGLADHTREINVKAAEIARRAAGPERFVAGSIGPTGFLPASDDPTLGQITFAQLREVFAEQSAGLLEGGADLIIIETTQDILELKAAVFGARLEHRSVDALDHVGAVEHKHLVAATGEFVVLLEAELELLQGRAHATVVDERLLAERGDEVAHSGHSINP